jgi:hypothetical protein
MTPTFYPTTTCHNNRWSVHLQTDNSRSASRSQTPHIRSVINPFKVRRPDLSTRIEPRDVFASFWVRDNRCLPFVIVTIPTGKTQIIQVIATIRIDVINLHGLTAIHFTRLTIFTTTVCSFRDTLADFTPREIIHPVDQNPFE